MNTKRYITVEIAQDKEVSVYRLAEYFASKYDGKKS
jgi:hypothetical protein